MAKRKSLITREAYKEYKETQKALAEQPHVAKNTAVEMAESRRQFASIRLGNFAHAESIHASLVASMTTTTKSTDGKVSVRIKKEQIEKAQEDYKINKNIIATGLIGADVANNKDAALEKVLAEQNATATLSA